MNTKTQTLATILMVAMLWGNAVWGQGFRNVGYAGANFLKIPVEPVGAALGNAIVARADGVLGLYWNPGAIAQSEKTEILASTVDWIADTRVSFLGVIHPLPFGTLGISATALTMKEMEITTEYLPGGTGQFFGAGSYAFGLSYSTRIIDRFSFGITAKYIYEYIWETHGSTFAFDLGSVYITDFQNLRIGMRIANFGGGMTFSGAPIDGKAEEVASSGVSFPNDPRLDRVSEKSSLPQSFTVGVSIDPYRTDEHRLTIMAAVNDPNDNVTQVVVGGEYAFEDLVFVRAGYKSGMDEQSYTLGVGLRGELAGVLGSFDYAYSSMGILGKINTFSLRFGF